MLCRRCKQSTAHFVVHSDLTMGGERIVIDNPVCSACAWKVFEWELPNHRVRELTEKDELMLDS